MKGMTNEGHRILDKAIETYGTSMAAYAIRQTYPAETQAKIETNMRRAKEALREVVYTIADIAYLQGANDNY